MDPKPFDEALSRAVRRLLLLRDPAQVRRELPRVALSLVPADVGLLVEDADNPVVIGQFGALEGADWQWMRPCVREAMSQRAPQLFIGNDTRPREGKGRLIVVPVSRRPARALVVARTVSHGRMKEEAVGPLSVFGRVGALALDFAALRQHAVDLRARLEQTAEAVEGGLIVLDANGDVAVMNGIAGWWLDIEPQRALGQALVDLPGGGRLLAVVRGERRPRMVELPGGLADVRHRRWDRGSLLVLEGDLTSGIALAPGASLSSIFEEPPSEELGPADDVLELALQAVGAATTPVVAPPRGAAPIDLGDAVLPLAEIRRRAVENALAVFEGDTVKAARALEISEAELFRIRAEHGF